MDGTAGSGALVGVLGPLVLKGGRGTAVRLGSGRQRRLLAALALYAGADVPCNRLAELVWGTSYRPTPTGRYRPTSRACDGYSRSGRDR